MSEIKNSHQGPKRRTHGNKTGIDGGGIEWGCEKCGSHFDLDSPSGRCSAHYGLCRKCFSEIQLQAYKNANILQKILYFIPHIIILRGYNRYYGKKEK